MVLAGVDGQEGRGGLKRRLLAGSRAPHARTTRLGVVLFIYFAGLLPVFPSSSFLLFPPTPISDNELVGVTS